MFLPRFRFLAALWVALILALTASSTALIAPLSMAQAWPTKTVRIVVPAPAGSSLDFVSRILSEKLKDKWGQAVVVDPKPGAGGMIGLGAIKSGTQDDHTFALVPASVITEATVVLPSPSLSAVLSASSGVAPLMASRRGA